MVRSSAGAVARLPSADQTTSLTSGVMATFSCASSPAVHSAAQLRTRSEEHTSELQSLMRISYAVFCLKKKNNNKCNKQTLNHTYIHVCHIKTDNLKTTDD